MLGRGLNLRSTSRLVLLKKRQTTGILLLYLAVAGRPRLAANRFALFSSGAKKRQATVDLPLRFVLRALLVGIVFVMVVGDGARSLWSRMWNLAKASLQQLRETTVIILTFWI